MRIFSVVLTLIISLIGSASPICGKYKVQAFVPEKTEGKEAHVNPDMVASTKLIFKTPVPKEYWGRVIEIETTFKSLCLLSCEVSEYKIIKAVSPFEKIKIFNHNRSGLVKKMKCERTF